MPHRRDVVIAEVLTAVACIYYFALLTNGDWNPYGPELGGFIFNDMLAHLLKGDVAVDPLIVGGEGFAAQGRTVTYWGIFPAFVRLPLVPFGALYELQIARFSCWLAVCGLASALVATFVAVHRLGAPSPRRSVLFHAAVVSVLFAGSVLTSMGSAYMYNEPIFWAAALAAAFNYVVLRQVLAGKALSATDLAILAALAGLALNCRVLEGVGLCLAFAWIALLRKGAAREVIAAGAIVVFFVAVCGTVNYLRWGSPFTFIDMHLHTHFLAKPDSLAALQASGETNVRRLPFALFYYLSGIDLRPLLGSPDRLYGIEPPASALLLTDSVPLLLAAFGAAYMLRRNRLLAGVLMAQLLAVAVLFVAQYVTLRYRMDFVPALTLAAAVGIFALGSRAVVPRLAVTMAVLLMISSLIASHVVLGGYKQELVQFRVLP